MSSYTCWDFVPLIATLWASQVSPFLVHLTAHLPSPILHQLVYEGVTGDRAEGLGKGRTNNIHCFTLIHQATHLIVEGYQFG